MEISNTRLPIVWAYADEGIARSDPVGQAVMVVPFCGDEGVVVSDNLGRRNDWFELL